MHGRYYIDKLLKVSCRNCELEQSYDTNYVQRSNGSINDVNVELGMNFEKNCGNDSLPTNQPRETMRLVVNCYDLVNYPYSVNKSLITVSCRDESRRCIDDFRAIVIVKINIEKLNIHMLLLQP